MSIQHTVVFTLRHAPGSSEEAAFLEAGRTALTSIPEARGFTINRQVSPRSGHRWQFSMIFDDQDAYDRYNNHPAHVGFVAGHWVPEVESFQEYDFVPVEPAAD